MSSVFVDRIEITTELYNKIQNRNSALVILLYSETGVGKTSLAKKLLQLLQSEKTDSISISVPMNPVNSASSVSNNEYAIAIFRKLYTYFGRTNFESGVINNKLYCKFSFKNYIANVKNPKIKKHLLEFINEKFIQTAQVKGDILRDALDVLFQRIFKIGIFDEDSIVEELEKNVCIVNDYIEYVLKEIKSYIHIDNIQNIDAFSSKYLLEWICASQTQKNVFILEYTVSLENDILLARFADSLELTKAEIIKVGLKRLKEDDVVEIALSQSPLKGEDDKFKNNVKAHYIAKSNGNIFELEKYVLMYDLYEQHVNDNALRQGLLLLDENQKLIISIIILHSGKVLERTLKAIIRQSNMLLFEDELDELIIGIEYVIKEGDSYALKHASIIDTWKNCKALKKEKAYFIAYKYCVEYYSNILKLGNFFCVSRDKCIALLLDLYAEFDSQELIGLIDELDEISISVLSPKEVWKKVSIIYEKIRPVADIFEKEIYHIIRICLNCELFEKAQYCLENITIPQFQKKSKFHLYRCLIYSLREKHLDVLKCIESNLHRFDLETDQYFYLFKISSLRSTNQEDELKALVKELRQEHVFKNEYTFGCFLRLAETYECRRDAVRYVRQSIDVFEAMGDMEQASKSRISLSYLLAITGNVSAAFEESTVAEKQLVTSIRNRCIFNVNKAALMLLSGEYSETVWDLLDEAEPLTNTVFNRVAIYINKLVYCIEKKDSDIGDFCAEKLINELQNESDRHVIAIGAYDLYLYYTWTQKLELAYRFYSIAHKNRHYCNILYARMAAPQRQYPDSSFLLSKPWHVCFLSYWDVDLKLG